jgi:predicted PurR-regulated permease PerM
LCRTAPTPHRVAHRQGRALASPTLAIAIAREGEEVAREPDHEVAVPEANPLHALTWAVWLVVGLGTIALLYAARDFFIPLLVGFVLAYALRPAVELLAALRLPRRLAAFLAVGAALSTVALGIYSLSDDAMRLVETLPKAARTVRMAIQDAPREKPKAISNVREAAREIDKAAAEASGQPVATPLASPSPGTRMQEYLVAKGVSVAAVLVQVFFAALLAWYLLGEGDTFKRKMLRLVGPSLSRKKITARILDDIDRSVQRQVFMMFVVNALIGVATTICFAALGVEQAILWGVVSALLHFVPYVGQAIVTVASGAAAYLQFANVGGAIGVAAATLAISLGVGTLFATWLQSRASRVNQTVLFVAILFFGWLWGAWGLVLAAPLVAMVKSVCDHVEAFQPAGEFLSGGKAVPVPGAAPRESSSA